VLRGSHLVFEVKKCSRSFGKSIMKVDDSNKKFGKIPLNSATLMRHPAKPYHIVPFYKNKNKALFNFIAFFFSFF
jgi:hypothetical protein